MVVVRFYGAPKVYEMIFLNSLGSLMNRDFDGHVDFGNNFEQKNDHVPERIAIHNWLWRVSRRDHPNFFDHHFWAPQNWTIPIHNWPESCSYWTLLYLKMKNYEWRLLDFVGLQKSTNLDFWADLGQLWTEILMDTWILMNFVFFMRQESSVKNACVKTLEGVLTCVFTSFLALVLLGGKCMCEKSWKLALVCWRIFWCHFSRQ